MDHPRQWSLSTIVLAPRGRKLHAASAERAELLAWAAQTGFDSVELSDKWVDIYEMSPVELRALAWEIRACGLSVSGINVDRVLERRGTSAVLERHRFDRVLLITEEMEAPLISLSFSVPLGDRILRSRDFEAAEVASIAAEAKRLARDSRRSGVEISFELHDDGILDSADACLQFLERVAETNTGVNPDLGNLMRDPEHPLHDWRSTLRSLAPYTNCWHVKNYRSGRMISLDAGEIDFVEAAGILSRAGCEPVVSIEDRSGEYRDTQRRGLEFMKSAVKLANRQPMEAS